MIKKVIYILFSLLITIELFGFDWSVEQKNNEYIYEIKFNESEINSFVETGKPFKLPDGFLRANVNDAMLFSYNLILENETTNLSLSYINKKIENYDLNFNLKSVSDDPNAVNELKINYTNFVDISSIPQDGSILQIFPILPIGKNKVKILRSAKFILNSYSKPLTHFTENKRIINLNKGQNYRDELPAEYINLYVNEPGLYKITGKELEIAGADISQIDINYIKAYRWGEEIPLRLETNSFGSVMLSQEDNIFFLIDTLSNPFANYKYNPFTSYEAIRIEWTADKLGKRFIEESGALKGEPDMVPADYNYSSQFTYHFEENQTWDNLGHIDVDKFTYKSDHWFMDPPISDINAEYFYFDINNIANSMNNVEFTIRLQGLTYEGLGEHKVDISVNDVQIATEVWYDQNPITINVTDRNFLHRYLKEGKNTVRIFLSGDNTTEGNTILLDWMKIKYDKEFVAYNDILEFQVPQGYKKGNYLFELKNYSSLKNAMVIKNELWWIRDLTVYKDNNTNKYSILFQDSIVTKNEKYYTVGENGIKNVDSLCYVDFNEPELRYTHNEGDYIIISDSEYFSELERFISLKQEKGFNPIIYNINQIYDEYSNSNLSPFAIKHFLTDAYYNWSNRPKYVLLVGDVTTRGRIDESIKWYIPTMYYQAAPSKGGVLTDVWFSDINDDFYQDISIGRWPVRNKDQLNRMIDKTIAFENLTTINSWLNKNVMIAGYEDVFKGETESLINDIVPEYMQTDRYYIYSTESGPYAGKAGGITEMFNDGRVMINYFGHGGGANWSDRNVFPIEDAQYLTNKLMPTMVNSLTCFSLTFDSERSIGEALMRAEGGSVTFFGASGWGYINNDYWLAQNILDQVFKKQISIGKAIQLGKLYYFFSNLNQYRKTMYYQFNLLGDPSLKLPIDYTPLELTSSNKMVNPGDSLKFSLPQESALYGSYDVTYDSTVLHPIDVNYNAIPMNSKVPLYHNENINFINSDVEYSVKIPENINANRGDISLCIWNENNYQASHLQFSIGSSYIGEPSFYPNRPKVGEDAYVQVNIEDVDGINSAYLDFSSSDQNCELIEQSENNYRSDNSYNWDENNGKTFKIIVVDTNNDTTTSREHNLIPSEIFDIEIKNYDIVNGMSEIEIRSNYNESFDVELVTTTLSDKIGISYCDTLTVVDDSNSSINKAYSSILPPWGDVEIEVRIKPLIDINEVDTTNNIDTISIKNYWINENTELNFNFNDSIFTSLKIIPKENKYKAFIKPLECDFNLNEFGANLIGNRGLKVMTENEIEFQINLNSQNINIDSTNFISWLSLDSSKFHCKKYLEDNSDKFFNINKAGYYIFAQSIDNLAPKIRLNVNGGKLLTNSYVANNSRCSAIINDNNGVNPESEYWKILIDDMEIDQSNIVILQGNDIKTLGLKFNLELEKGDHTLQMLATDIVGNESYSQKYQINYLEESKVIDYGNYPNPFAIKTLIIYELTDQFENLEINIYTLAGKKILTIDQYNAETDLLLNNIGYHEIPWNGRDKYNNYVANGVYFYEIKGIIDDNVKKKTGKIVKLR